MEDEEESAWWRDTRQLASAVLGAAAGIVLVSAVATMLLDEGEFFGFSPGYFFAAILVPIALAALVFWFCGRQTLVDRRHGLGED